MRKTIKQSKLREKNIVITVGVILLTWLAMIVAYMRINTITVERCIERMQEAAETVIDDIDNKLYRDSRLLNAVADMIEDQGDIANMDPETLHSIIKPFSPLTTANEINILLADNTVIYHDGTVIKPEEAEGKISFEQEVLLGEHVTDRMVSLLDDNELVIRHFVPIKDKKSGQVVAMLFGTTHLKNLHYALNISNIYNSTASVFIIDRKNGDMLVDTWHDSLGNLMDYADHKSKGDKTMREACNEILDGGSGYTVYLSNSYGDYVYLYYDSISESQWHQLGESKDLNKWSVAVAVPEEEVLRSVIRIRYVCYVLALIEVVLLLIYFLWTLHNTSVTMEKAVLQERLTKAENAERAKTMFLSNMSHDIRTPMNAIIGYTTLAAANIENKPRVQDYLSKILASSNHLLSLINDVLDMSRIESGRVDIEETECSLPEMLYDLRNILVNQIQAKQLDFYIDTIDVIDEDIYCDRLHLNQVLLNLLSNAIKFTPSGGSVSLIIKQKHGAPEGYAAYEIRVKDTGIGMSPEFLEKVFEPFEREKTSTVSGIQGTGLGMAIAKNIIDMMGGTIEAFSEQGKGSEFVLSLEFRLLSERKQVEVIKELEGMRALVVDDDYTVCDSVTKMLVQLGLRADWTLSGREAVLHAKQASELADDFNAYIIDLYMPDLSGLEVVRRIRSDVGENVPIIILTAYDWSTIEDEARAAGVTAFCNKPIFLSTLRDTLISAIAPQSVAEEEPVLPETSEDMHGKRLLLVEDNELNREIAVEILTESGFEVETACDGTEAVEIMKTVEDGRFDLILMDIQMPIMNGYDATRAIRALGSTYAANVPIVAMTANAFDEDKKNAIDAGMNDHIAKPLDLDRLFEVLHKHLKK